MTSSTILPNEIIPNISKSLLDPQDWMHSMETCKQWREILYPLYLETDFKVIFIERKYHPSCMIEKICNKYYKSHMSFYLKDIEGYYMILDPKIIKHHFMLIHQSPIYLVPGMYLPFMEIKHNRNAAQYKYKETLGYELTLNKTNMLDHFMLKFPAPNKHIQDIIQRVRLRKTEYIICKVDYVELFSQQIKIFYTKNPRLIGTITYMKDQQALKVKDEDKTYRHCIDAIHLFTLFSKNINGNCPFCDEYHNDIYDRAYYTYPVSDSI